MRLSDMSTQLITKFFQFNLHVSKRVALEIAVKGIKSLRECTIFYPFIPGAIWLIGCAFLWIFCCLFGPLKNPYLSRCQKKKIIEKYKYNKSEFNSVKVISANEGSASP